jgi:hypothetical protein
MCRDGHQQLEQEGSDEPADEPVKEARLGQSEAEPLITLDVLAQLRLTGLGLDGGAEHSTDARARARGTAARTNTEGDGLAGLLAVGVRCHAEKRVEDRQEMEEQHLLGSSL